MENKDKLVSVILCTFNGEKFLRVQLDSICNQTYKKLEVIVLDDCSTDDTVKIAKEYEDKFSFLRVIKNETNLGINKNMELGFTLAKGEFICPADQDDSWELNKIQILVDLIESRKCSLVYCNSYFTDENLVKLGFSENDMNPYVEGNNYKNLLIYNCISGHSMLFEKDLLQGLGSLDLKTIYYDQWLGMAALLRKGLAFTTENLVSFRRHNNAQTHNIRTHKQYFEHIGTVLTYLETHPFLDDNKRNFTKKLSYLFNNNKSIYNKFSLWFMLLINVKSLYKIRNKGFFSTLIYIRKVAFRFSN